MPRWCSSSRKSAQPAKIELPRGQFQVAPAGFAHPGDVHVGALQQIENRLVLASAVDIRIHGRTKKETLGRWRAILGKRRRSGQAGQ